jgi:hypothetical protein
MLKLMLCLLLQQPNLDELVAPVALFPDSVLAQVLAAATYPLDVVEAARWQEANKNLKGEALKTALDKKKWDPSIKALVGMPEVLQSMNKKLSWTRQIGEAFVDHPKEVMAAVQDFRARSQAAGKLTSTASTKVVDQQGAIRIEPTDPGHIAIPTYSVERVNEGTYIPAGAPAFGTSEYDSMYGMYGSWGMDWWGGGPWIAPPVNVEINNNWNFNRGQINPQVSATAMANAQNAQATRWQYQNPRATTAAATASTMRPATKNTPGNTPGTKPAPGTRPAPNPATKQAIAKQQPRNQYRGDRPSNANLNAQNRQKLAAAFGDYGRGSNVAAARQRGQQSRQGWHGRSYRPPPPRQAPQQRNAFQNYGNGRQAAMQSSRGRGSRGGRGR